MKVIYSGLESSGKSLQLAMKVEELVDRNARWNKITGASRPIVSNMQFSSTFELYAKKKNVVLKYWQNLDELVQIEGADIICDEVGNYFDSRLWADLSLDVRRWLTQGAKRGIEFYGAAQDFAQVDLSFRRLVQPGDLYLITKVIGSRRPTATKPPVKYVWGLCMVQSLNPQGYKEDKKKFESTGIPNFFFIRKEYCQIFNTQQKIVRSAPPPLHHLDRACERNDCSFHKIQHV